MIKSYNKICSGFEEIISGAPQSSIVGPIMLKAFLNDLFYYIENGSVHNFTNDTTLPWFPKKINDLMNLLKKDSKVAVRRFSETKTILNLNEIMEI